MSDDSFVGITSAIIVLVVIAIIAIGGYALATGEDNGLPSGVTRFVDQEAGVVCWVYSDQMSCLPVEETRLDR